MKPHEDPLLIAIVGPTASGKSALGVWLAQQANGEVIACDSTQLYRGLDVGTAKPTMAERQGVPHHLIDVLLPEEEATAGAYRERALAVLDDLKGRQRLPIFTVGTGLYLRVLLEGIADVPLRSEAIRQELRESARERGPEYLHETLKQLDPAAAEKIAAADVQKVIRAIEICRLAGKPVSQVHQEGKTPLQGWRVVKIGLAPERAKLYERIHSRTEGMFEAGWIEEVKALLAKGIPVTAKPFDFIGYRELSAVAQGTMILEEARELIQQATRQYAKRQITWFRREAGVEWLVGFGDEAEIQRQALELVKRGAKARLPLGNRLDV